MPTSNKNSTVQQESIAANKNIALLLLLDQWVTFKEGSLVSDRATSIIRALSSLLRAGLMNEEQQVVASTVARLLVSPKVDVVLDDVNAVSKLIYSQNCHLSAVLSFSTAVANHRWAESVYFVRNEFYIKCTTIRCQVLRVAFAATILVLLPSGRRRR